MLSLRSEEKSAPLYLVFLYCRCVDDEGFKRIKPENLLKGKEDVDWLKFNCEAAVREHALLDILEVDPEGYIQLKSELQKHTADVCSKIGRYWSFVSGLYSGGNEFREAIGDDVKKGVLLFNEGFYFECHEFLEEIWKRERGREKSFLKGLIQTSVALYHLEYENLNGAIGYLERSRLRLEEFEPVFLGVDVEAFVRRMGDYLKLLESGCSNIERLKASAPKIPFAA